MAEPPSVDSFGASGTYESSSGSDGSCPFSSKVEGYDYDFVPAPDSRYECAICLMVLREPRQTPCGHRFCRDCILKWLRESHTRCPADNEEISEKDLFPDNFAKREIQNFNVRCPNSKEGCEVITTVKQVPDHQNECPLALVPCPNKCSHVLRRRDLDQHVRESCDRRTIECPDCHSHFIATEFEDHAQSCPQGKVTCQLCEEEVSRQALSQHEEETCPKKEVSCTFSMLGCEVKAKRCEMDSHQQEGLVSHVRLLCEGVTHIFRHLKLPPLSGEEIGLTRQALSPTEMTGTVSNMASIVNQLTSPLSSMASPATSDTRQIQQGITGVSLPPSSQALRFPVTSSSAESLPPMSHPGKYQMDPKHHLLNAMSWGTEEASLMRCMSEGRDYEGLEMSPSSYGAAGRFDSTSKSLSTLQDEQKLVVHDQKLLALQAKVEAMERSYKKLKVHEQQLSEMEGRICNGLFFWKIRNYSRYQLEAEHGETTALHSQPFYTSPSGGYKLCVRANLNGVDSARGSHLSLFIHFMQGEYDDVLDWPFSGRIILSVMDQNDCCELRNHVAETLSAKPNLAAFQKPTTPRNHKGFGYMEFLPLSVLKHSSYVKNDTLIIKVHVLPNG